MGGNNEWVVAMFRRKDRQLDLLREYQQALQDQGARPIQTWRTPTRPPGFVSDYIVPVSHALTWGIILASLITILYNQGEDPQADLTLIWFTWFLIITCIAYLLTSMAIWSLLWAALENVLQKDLDRSGNIGDRPIIKGRRHVPNDRGVSGKVNAREIGTENLGDAKETESPEVEVMDWTQVILEFPFYGKETTMKWFVRVSGDPRVGTNGRIWERILGRKRYQHFRDALIDAGWARWNSYSEDDGQPNVTTGWSYDEDPEKIREHIS